MERCLTVVLEVYVLNLQFVACGVFVAVWLVSIDPKLLC